MKLHTKSYGSGFPLIILHGLLGSLDNWQTIAKHMATYFEVLCMDLRNHGRSGRDPHFSYEAMVNDVIETMQLLNIEKAHVLGHSMGGKVAMYTALSNPEKVQKLVVVDIAPKTYTPHHDDVFAALKAVSLQDITSRSDAESIIRTYIVEEDVVQFLMKGLYRDEQNAFAWRYNLDAIIPAYAEILDFNAKAKLYKGDTLFIRGAQSKYIQELDEENIYTIFPNSHIETIEDAGHWVHSQRPNEMIQQLERFLHY